MGSILLPYLCAALLLLLVVVVVLLLSLLLPVTECLVSHCLFRFTPRNFFCRPRVRSVDG